MTKTQKLKGYIVSKGLTQGEISEKMEINKGTLSRKMNNQTPPNSEELVMLNETLKSSKKQFYDELYDIQRLVPWYFHYETRRQFRANGLEEKYRKLLGDIISNFEQLKRARGFIWRNR